MHPMTKFETLSRSTLLTAKSNEYSMVTCNLFAKILFLSTHMAIVRQDFKHKMTQTKVFCLVAKNYITRYFENTKITFWTLFLA